MVSIQTGTTHDINYVDVFIICKTRTHGAAVIEFFDHFRVHVCQCLRNVWSCRAVRLCIDIVILQGEQSSEVGIRFNRHARQWHAAPSKVSPHQRAFKLQLRTGFIPEHFLTAKIEIKRCKSYHKPAQILIFIPFFSSCCHICSYDGLHLFYSKGWIPTCDLFKKKLGKKKQPCFHRKEWGNGCLQDMNLLFEITHWHKSSKGFTLHQELHFWKKIWWING